MAKFDSKLFSVIRITRVFNYRNVLSLSTISRNLILADVDCPESSSLRLYFNYNLIMVAGHVPLFFISFGTTRFLSTTYRTFEFICVHGSVFCIYFFWLSLITVRFVSCIVLFTIRNRTLTSVYDNQSENHELEIQSVPRGKKTLCKLRVKKIVKYEKIFRPRVVT